MKKFDASNSFVYTSWDLWVAVEHYFECLNNCHREWRPQPTPCLIPNANMYACKVYIFLIFILDFVSHFITFIGRYLIELIVSMDTGEASSNIRTITSSINICILNTVNYWISYSIKWKLVNDPKGSVRSSTITKIEVFTTFLFLPLQVLSS